MAIPPTPPDEGQRLEAVRDLGLYGTPGEERFDHIVRIARAALRVPYAAINVLGEHALWQKAGEGGPLAIEHARESTYCAWAILEDGIATIEDATVDPRTSDNPHAADFRFYAAKPLEHAGRKIGVMCIGGPEPRVLQDDELDVLRDLGAMVEEQLKARHLGVEQLRLAAELAEARANASVDPLTRVWSRSAIIELAGRAIQRGRAGFLMVDVDHFKGVNDSYGHQAGDEVLRRVADRLKGALRGDDAVGRYGGEEFLVVLPGCEQTSLEAVAERLRLAVARVPVTAAGASFYVTVSIGGAIGDSSDHFAELVLKGADEALYAAKAAGRNRVVTRRITPSLYMRAVQLAPSPD